jgi:hypothetical protein
MKFDERNQNIYKIPPFLFAMATAKICEVWSEFNIFYTLVTMATAAILTLFTPPPSPKICHTTVDIPTKFHEV